MTQLVTISAIIAITQWIKLAFPNVAGWVTILVATVIGLLAGLANFEGLNPLSGVMNAWAAVGVHTVASSVGKA